MEVYIDDMLVKSARATQHVDHLGEMFGVLRRYHMKLNPLKCAFGVGSGKFLGFMVSNWGIEANPKRIKALQDMRSLTKPKEVQRLTGCVTALNRFISKGTDKPPILSKPIPDKELSLHLSVSQHAVSSVLIREEERFQLPVYYVSKRLLDAESRYTEMEQMALTLMVASRKLRHYFQSHTIRVLTNHPLRQVLQKLKTSGRLLKWSVELSQFDIKYVPRVAIKGQALADFLAEFSHRPTPATREEVEMTKWKLYVDGASNKNGSGTGILLISPEGHKITSMARHLQRLSTGRWTSKRGIPSARQKNGCILRKVKEELVKFKSYEIIQIPRAENTNANALAKLASSRDFDILGIVPIEELERLTIEEKIEALTIQTDEGWMTPLIQYLTNVKLPNDKDDARRIRYRATRYLLYDGLLYRRGYSMPLQRCLNDSEAQEVLREIHEGGCGNHTGGQSLALKVLRQGYYWPTLKKDAFQYARRYDKCQKYATIPRAPQENLTPILSSWPFAKWRVDLIGPLHLALGGFKFTIVALDYYTKWAEVKALTTTTEAACANFMWTH
ncbi:uncharacterized protein LOC112093264 [Morus notabilis]|uniref:uncharacterized protein LOC112093264 n=1 Tax=Morus notabilis TaxID=981085 RepID=UPI000CED67EB|nr:uncharacterized protein LOC112093264 [Morus notabilis]